MLARCLESVREADEIIVVDTGSTDKTVEIAKQFTDKVYEDFKWNDSFCDARNHAKSKATGDYVLSIDADEVLHDWAKVREAVERGEPVYDVTLIHGTTGQKHWFSRLFKNVPEISWAGAVHNHLNTTEGSRSDVEITYHNSPAHELDPDRTLRILEREVQKPDRTREMYYLGREYLYYGRFQECVQTMFKYTQQSNFLQEKADAYLIMSRAYWGLQDAESARNACLQAININPHFREAVLWMGAISLPWNAEQWFNMAKSANNTNVLFIRVGEYQKENKV